MSEPQAKPLGGVPGVKQPPGPPLKPGTIRTIGPDGRKILSTWKAKLVFTQRLRFNFFQRLKMLLGYEMDCNVVVFCEHTPGQYAVNFTPVLTVLTDKKEVKTIGKLRHIFRPRISEAPPAVGQEVTQETKGTQNAQIKN